MIEVPTDTSTPPSLFSSLPFSSLLYNPLHSFLQLSLFTLFLWSLLHFLQRNPSPRIHHHLKNDGRKGRFRSELELELELVRESPVLAVESNAFVFSSFAFPASEKSLEPRLQICRYFFWWNLWSYSLYVWISTLSEIFLHRSLDLLKDPFFLSFVFRIFIEICRSGEESEFWDLFSHFWSFDSTIRKVLWFFFFLVSKSFLQRMCPICLVIMRLSAEHDLNDSFHLFHYKKVNFIFFLSIWCGRSLT